MNVFTINGCYEIILLLLKRPMHGRGLADYLRLPLTTVQNRLHVLTREGVVDYHTEGKNKIFALKKNPVAKANIIMAEQYKLLKLYHSYPELQVILDEVAKQFKGMTILFGSYAKFLAKKDSDIDLYIASNERKVKERVQQVNSRLSVQMGMLSKTDALSQEILQDHVIVSGVEEYYAAFPH
ncbi:MAG: nucleotidyltransferase domain-containing protein [archaeon]